MIAIMSALADALAPHLTHELVAEAGSTLFHQGDRVDHLYVVRSGCVHLVRYGEDGAAAVMQRATPGAVLAESSIFSEAYHCDAAVIEDASLGRADVSRLREAMRSDTDLLEAVTRHLAREVHQMRSRLELLSRRTVKERLDGWLALNEGVLPPHGSWRALADYIGVSPEAFYRELKRRRAS